MCLVCLDGVGDDELLEPRIRTKLVQRVENWLVTFVDREVLNELLEMQFDHARGLNCNVQG